MAVMGRVDASNMNLSDNLSNELPEYKQIRSISLAMQYIVVISICFIVSFLLFKTLWNENKDLLHTLIELATIFIAISLWITIWLTSKIYNSVNRLISFGFLAAAVFNIFHTYYYPLLYTYPAGQYDLSTKYWILSRLTEALAILLMSLKLNNCKFKKWVGLITAFTSSTVISYLFLLYPGSFPTLSTVPGIVPAKILSVSIIICIFVLSLYFFRNDINNRGVWNYRYIFLAVLIEIPAELCFALNSSKASHFHVFGHVLKAVYYYFLFNGITVNTITFPYKKLKRANNLLDLTFQTQTILNCINILVLVFDCNNKIIMCNKAVSEAVGLDYNKITGTSLDKFYEMVKFQIRNSPFQPHNNSKYGTYYEATFINANGAKKELMIHNSPIANVNNEVIGYISVGSDITLMEEQQRKAQQQEKLAIIGQMGSGIVHETKNHLASIKGYCQLISLKSADEQIRKYSERIESITTNVNKVITDFLALASPTLPEIKELSLNELVQSVRYMLESPSFMKGVRINFTLSALEKNIRADKSQLKQVILNLAKNAIEAMSDSENPLLGISTGYNTETGKMLLIISDNGRGISEDEKLKIGTPFFTTKENGTGLGLSVSYRIIEEHGGSVKVQSDEGKGTTFTISFPTKV